MYMTGGMFAVPRDDRQLEKGQILGSESLGGIAVDDPDM
jgi:hypothetical protein